MYHPAAALHQQGMRRFLEEDIQSLPAILERLRGETAPVAPPAAEEPQQLKLL
jgi:DNA polymerase